MTDDSTRRLPYRFAVRAAAVAHNAVIIINSDVAVRDCDDPFSNTILRLKAKFPQQREHGGRLNSQAVVKGLDNRCAQ